jgi:hypothetical protein
MNPARKYMSEERESRNQVFSAQAAAAAANPGIQTTSASEKAKADFGLDIPVEVVPLPSGGKVYPVNSTLFGRETVDIKAMTAREEDILTSRALMKKGTVVSELIRSCLVDKTINVSDLLAGDRNALMVAIRITGYGPEYDAEIECEECNVKSPQQFDLGALPLKRMPIDPISPGVNVFEFLLPYTKKVVRFKFLTGGVEEEIGSMQEKQKKLGMYSDSVVTTNLFHSIVSIDGIEDRAKISNFIRVMPARDSLALRNYIKDNEPGISMKQETVCPACGHASEVQMPIGVNFLWPSVGR